VHHGNGTQDIFWEDPSVLYVSTHQAPFYPGTGAPGEIGEGAGRGTTVNVPLPAGLGDAEFDWLFASLVAPAVSAFAPGLILISAGFDAHVADPVGGMRVSTGGFVALAHRLRRVGDTLGAPLVAVLEGGYDLSGLADSTRAVLEVLEGAGLEAQHIPGAPDPRAEAMRKRVLAALAGTPLGCALEAHD
jgi:acetoin utilization deacetylase AcuC-like enzyme